jgi:hypothetical protein
MSIVPGAVSWFGGHGPRDPDLEPASRGPGSSVLGGLETPLPGPSVGGPVSVRWAGPTSGRSRRGPELGGPPERLEKEGPDRLVADELDVLLSGVAGQLGREPEEPGPDPVRLSPPPASLECGGPKEVEELIGHGRQLPEQGVAPQVVHGGTAGTELGEFLDPLLHDGAVVVEAPGGEGVQPGMFVSTWALWTMRSLEKSAPSGVSVLRHSRDRSRPP